MPAMADIPLLAAFLGVGLAAGIFLVRRWIALRRQPAEGSEPWPAAIGLLDGLRLRGARGSLFERRLHPAWQKVAARAGLTDIEESGGSPSWVRGRWARLDVRLDSYLDDGRPGARLTVGGFGHGVAGLQLHRKTTLDPRSEPDDIATGDAVFDEEVRAQGHGPLALAVLDAETRPRLADLLRGQVSSPGQAPVEVSAVTFDAGVLEVRIDNRDLVARAGKLSDQLAERLAGVLEVARRLMVPDDIVERLAENMRREPQPAVRSRIVEVLGKLPSHPAAQGALLAARGDRSDAVRLQAAVALGEKGGETLLDLVRKSTDDPVAARAVAALGERLPPAEVQAALVRALDSGLGETARACLATLERGGWPDSESLLLRALAGDDAETAVAAARALGRVGTAAAVAALREEASIWRPELRSAARQAIAEIQARLTGAQAGQLSLAGSEAGALSLAPEPGRLSLDNTPGRLSLDDTPGQLSLTEDGPQDLSTRRDPRSEKPAGRLL
ncbi:MAG TPA: HEAT repeat domain-containing protein [Thermoanaerobaculia bacterium]|nr:HEAT repeat domain-containing protein [Thermoanaerobaculia bacterium]